MVMEDIRKSRPAYIVQTFRLEDFPELQAFVRDQYLLESIAEFSVPPYRIHLYRRRVDNQVIPTRGDALRWRELCTG